MILSAHQPAYLPWLGYFHKIMISDIFVILDDVQFEKNSFINRNKIKTNQEPIWLTVPLLMKQHTAKTIKEMETNAHENWGEKHWKSLSMNYRKAPYFQQYAAFFEETYCRSWPIFMDLIDHFNRFWFEILDIKTKIIKQSDLGIKSAKQDLILDLCAAVKADQYVSGALGKDYLEATKFQEKAIQLYFQSYNINNYDQLYGEFLPYLSMPDLLFNVSRERIGDVIMNANIKKTDMFIPQ